MDQLSDIKHPIERELERFNALFNHALSGETELLTQVLSHIKQRMGKRMRPILVLLTAKAFGEITDTTHNAAIGLELLHTASLVHDDVVDEADIRRGQASVNATYDNKIAVLTGDYILATALLKISHTGRNDIVEYLSSLGRTLAAGELLQLSTVGQDEISEETYIEIVSRKTAAMFETCAGMGAMSVDMPEEIVRKARMFGRNIGIAFQIRDDIFDYYDDTDIGKPTGNDMEEGKLTLPAIFALNTTRSEEYRATAKRVKRGTATKDEIAALIAFAKENGGIEYAEKRIKEYQSDAREFIKEYVKEPEIARSLALYVDYVVGREK
ncbi:MAG: polyprenyl synthetase family protein [Prevotella sp.]|nr:polyprenyl synthetase family protein [Prevotella sp.]